MSDGRLPKGPLHALVNRRLELANDLDLCARIYGQNVGTRAEIAQLSRILADAAREGDAVAQAIYVRAGQELADIVIAIRNQLGFAEGETVPVSTSGGAFSAGDLLMQPFGTALHAASPLFEIRTPLHEPHYGAALYARQLAAR